MNPQQLLRLLTAPAESVLTQLPRALVVSVLAMLVDVGVLFSLMALGMSSREAFVLGYLTGCVLQYVLCSTWVFPNAPRSASVGFLAFMVLSLGGLAITEGTRLAVHEALGWSAGVAKFMALGLAFNWNFFSRKFLLFSPASAEAQAQTAE